MKNAILAIFATLSFSSLPAHASRVCVHGDWKVEFFLDSSGEHDQINIYNGKNLLFQDFAGKDEVGYTEGQCNVKYGYEVKTQLFTYDGCSQFHPTWPRYIYGPDFGQGLDLKIFTCSEF